MRQIAALGIFGILWALPALAADGVLVSAAEVENYGLLQMVHGRLVDHDHVADDVDILERTDQIPGKIGVNFGLRYVVNSDMRGASMIVTQVIKFPGDGIQLPDGTMRKESRWTNAIHVGYPAFFGYRLDEAREIVPGRWTFEVWFHQSCILRQVFTVKSAPASK